MMRRHVHDRRGIQAQRRTGVLERGYHCRSAAEAIVVVRCSAMAWTDEEHTGKVLVMHADPVASTAVVTVVQLAPDSTAAENRYMERDWKSLAARGDETCDEFGWDAGAHIHSVKISC